MESLCLKESWGGAVLDRVGQDGGWKTECIEHQEPALQTKAWLSKDGTQIDLKPSVLF